ncbi:probable methyltransferase-like protein 24 [Haliotis rubra]|uniref:probable methyltransferase-like protein 24 n=1 Tax=Haliotis rubra TaxID=36100 RepID=UPI001EE5B06D|nr:probable methyltransferase-like protein 24 [Haliotis rubra]
MMDIERNTSSMGGLTSTLYRKIMGMKFWSFVGVLAAVVWLLYWFSRTVLSPPHGFDVAQELEQLKEAEVLEIYHSYLDNIELPCERMLQAGPVGDEGWEVCDDEKFRPVKPCLAYSFGSHWGKSFQFDQDLARLYDCEVFSFDPTMKQDKEVKAKSVQYFDYALGNSLSKSSRVMTLTEIRHALNHDETTIDVLRIDLNGREWKVLRYMIQNRELSQVRQLFVEYNTDINPSTGELLRRLYTLKAIEEAGFKRFNIRKNQECTLFMNGVPEELWTNIDTGCYEVHYVNTFLTQ